MYEPIRHKSVHTVAGARADFPHRTREEELDIQLAGHLAALLAVIDEIRAVAPAAELDAAGRRLVAQVSRLRSGGPVARATLPSVDGMDAGADVRGEDEPQARIVALHRRAHDLAGRALVVAASRADTAAAILAAECMDLHAAGGRTTEDAQPQVAASL